VVKKPLYFVRIIFECWY